MKAILKKSGLPLRWRSIKSKGDTLILMLAKADDGSSHPPTVFVRPDVAAQRPASLVMSRMCFRP
jgi:hypothetical protein